MIVLDSSFLIAFHNGRDVHQAAAASAMESLLRGEFGRHLLIEYVFLEVVTVVLARRGHRAALDMADILLDAEELDFLPCSDLFPAVLREFRIRSAARLSFADAAIVAAAQRHGAEFIATFDEGFRGIEGITMVPAGGLRSTPARR